MVRIVYGLDTGRIYSATILFCWDDGTGGGSGGGGGSPAPPNEQEVTFTLSCPPMVTRGDTGKCSVTAEDEDGGLVDTGAFTFSWSSSLGASESGIGKDEWGGSSVDTWEGKATEDATVTVTVGGKRDSAAISVRDRFNFAFSTVYAPWSFSRTRTRGKLGLYDLPLSPSSVPDATPAGEGPWDGRYYMKDAPTPDVIIWVHDDYSSNGQDYGGSAGICGSNLGAMASYDAVNKACGSTGAWNSFRGDILDHEREHEGGINDCLTKSAAASRAAAAIETVVGGSASAVKEAAQDHWDNFYRKSLSLSGFRASSRSGGSHFKYRRSGGWVTGYPGIVAENGQHSC